MEVGRRLGGDWVALGGSWEEEAGRRLEAGGGWLGRGWVVAGWRLGGDWMEAGWRLDGS